MSEIDNFENVEGNDEVYKRDNQSRWNRTRKGDREESDSKKAKKNPREQEYTLE